MRLTRKTPDGSYELTDPRDPEAAVRRLGQAEDALENLSAQYHALEQKLETLRSQGRGSRSAEFSRLLAEKLMLSGMLERFRFFGLEP